MPVINTPYFQQILRGVFNVTEQPSFELPAAIVPVYNLAPNDVFFKLGACGFETAVALTSVSEPTAYLGRWYKAGAQANLTFDMFTGLKAGMVWRLMGHFTGSPGVANTDTTQVTLWDGTPAERGSLAVHAAGAFSASFDTGWIKQDQAGKIMLRASQNATSCIGLQYVFQILPSVS